MNTLKSTSIPQTTGQHTTPINRQSALFLSRKRHMETVQEAIDMAASYILNGKLNEQLAQAFTGEFGQEPTLTVSFSFRRDPKTPGRFSCTRKTKISHDLEGTASFFGLKP